MIAAVAADRGGAAAGAVPPPAAYTLFPGFFLVGGLSLPIYALCVAHTNDFLAPEQMVGASSALILAYGIGAAGGPTLTALAMQALGPIGFSPVPRAVHGAIGVFALYRMTRRPTVPAEEAAPTWRCRRRRRCDLAGAESASSQPDTANADGRGRAGRRRVSDAAAENWPRAPFLRSRLAGSGLWSRRG